MEKSQEYIIKMCIKNTPNNAIQQEALKLPCSAMNSTNQRNRELCRKKYHDVALVATASLLDDDVLSLIFKSGVLLSVL